MFVRMLDQMNGPNCWLFTVNLDLQPFTVHFDTSMQLIWTMPNKQICIVHLDKTKQTKLAAGHHFIRPSKYLTVQIDNLVASNQTFQKYGTIYRLCYNNLDCSSGQGKEGFLMLTKYHCWWGCRIIWSRMVGWCRLPRVLNRKRGVSWEGHLSCSPKH